jgi:hypothetical protein
MTKCNLPAAYRVMPEDGRVRCVGIAATEGGKHLTVATLTCHKATGVT